MKPNAEDDAIPVPPAPPRDRRAEGIVRLALTDAFARRIASGGAPTEPPRLAEDVARDIWRGRGGGARPGR